MTAQRTRETQRNARRVRVPVTVRVLRFAWRIASWSLRFACMVVVACALAVVLVASLVRGTRYDIGIQSMRTGGKRFFDVFFTGRRVTVSPWASNAPERKPDDTKAGKP